MLPLGCWIYPSLGSTVYYMETGLNNAFYVATRMLDLAWEVQCIIWKPNNAFYVATWMSVLYGNRA